jgi:hypothetical protein
MVGPAEAIMASVTVQLTPETERQLRLQARRRGQTLETYLSHLAEKEASGNADLDDLARLNPNWDGYGAPAIDPSIIAAARKFIQALPETLVLRPRVVPMSTGNLQFEWHHGSKILELEFETPEMIHFLQWHPEAGVEEEATFRASDIDRAVDLIQWFMSGTCV